MKFATELDAKVVDELQQIKNQGKATIQLAREDEASHTLSLVICTPKANKPSPLNITKPKKLKKKKLTILDLTTPSPRNEPLNTPTEMEMDTDSTLTTPICRSSAPSPAPVLTPTPAPDSIPTTLANPDTIPRWARTPSPDNSTPHAPTFTQSAPITDNTTTKVNPKFEAIMTAISSIRTDLLDHIEKVNAHVDQATGPQTISDYMVWNQENTMTWEHPRYIDPQHDDAMEALANTNAAKEAE
jgi:hypothetical protein